MTAYPYDPPHFFSDCAECAESTDQRDLSRHGHRWLCPTCSDREDSGVFERELWHCWNADVVARAVALSGRRSGCGEREAETPPMPDGDAYCVQCLLMLGAFLGAA